MNSRTNTLLCLLTMGVSTVNAFQAAVPAMHARGINNGRRSASNSQLEATMVDPSTELASSSLYVSAVDGFQKPAHEHVQSLFGPPDKYLSAGHSIHPNLKALGGDITTSPVDQLPQVAQEAAKKGYGILEAARFESSGGSVLPGFTPTGHILPGHIEVSDYTMATFSSQVFESAKFMEVFEKLPLVAFLYVLVDFFLLRPDADLYKEDIEDDPMDAFAETAAVTGVKLATFTAIGLFTVVVFG